MLVEEFFTLKTSTEFSSAAQYKEDFSDESVIHKSAPLFSKVSTVCLLPLLAAMTIGVELS